MSYLKDLKLILTLQVNQFLINMEKRIFALLRGYWLCRQKRLRQKLFELAVCDQFESSHRSLSNVIVVLILVQTSNILQGKWYRLSNTISQFGTETILSANVPQYLSIFPVFIRFFFGGGGGRKTYWKRRNGNGVNFFTRCNGNDPMNLHGGNFWCALLKLAGNFQSLVLVTGFHLTKKSKFPIYVSLNIMFPENQLRLNMSNIAL